MKHQTKRQIKFCLKHNKDHYIACLKFVNTRYKVEARTNRRRPPRPMYTPDLPF